MIKSFADKEAENIFNRHFSKRFPVSLQNKAYRKLLLLDAAEKLNDLRILQGNRLEKLSGKLKNFHSIRINNQWRIVFNWKRLDAYQVKITDYHKG